MSPPTIGVALYGANGHQVGAQLATIAGARLVACCQAEPPPGAAGVARYERLAELLTDPRVDMVSICAPRRAAQADAIWLALRAGKHVYAEKPLAMSVGDLERLQREARDNQVELFEMAGTAFEAPYAAVRPIVDGGALGQIVHVHVQKSYPYADWRPQDEAVDGGLILQVGVHAARLIEHAAGQRIVAVSAIATGAGNPGQGGLQMAAALTFQLEGGAIGSASLSYLNQPGTGGWGFEELRIFGVDGLLTTDLGRSQLRLVQGERSQTIDCPPQPPYLQRVVDALRGLAERPLAPEQETHPTRAVLRARESAVRGGVVLPV